MKTRRDLIRTISIVPGNLSHIESTGMINGTLLIEIERVMVEYAQQQVNNLNISAVSIAVCPKCKTKDTQVICCTCGHGDNIGDFRQTER